MSDSNGYYKHDSDPPAKLHRVESLEGVVETHDDRLGRIEEKIDKLTETVIELRTSYSIWRGLAYFAATTAVGLFMWALSLVGPKGGH